MGISVLGVSIVNSCVFQHQLGSECKTRRASAADGNVNGFYHRAVAARRFIVFLAMCQDSLDEGQKQAYI